MPNGRLMAQASWAEESPGTECGPFPLPGLRGRPGVVIADEAEGKVEFVPMSGDILGHH